MAALLGCAIGYGHHYWMVGRFLESTDDAYIKVDYTTIAPKVSGYIVQVLVGDNEAVRAGQILARIDDRDFRAALFQAQADIAAAEASIANIDAQIGLQRTIVTQQEAAIALTEASLSFAKAESDRYESLLKTGAGTVQRAQQTASAWSEARARLRRDQASRLAAEQSITVLQAERKKAEAQLDHAHAIASQAELNLSYTTISAPVDGTVGARSLRIGQYVTAGTQLMAVVPLASAYVVANFKETQLAHVRAGQPVEVEVDGVPGLTLAAHVDSISPASGLEFALLPPDNATGNFTKIVQRIPVRIVFDKGGDIGRLRAGMSVEPTIDTRREIAFPADGPMSSRAAFGKNRPRSLDEARTGLVVTN
ncbi:HlyD family secretion protein [Micromonospora sp. STR1s_5]|nr:HlyD family secretion protein [Micromonospora sp. STR1s_5]